MIFVGFQQTFYCGFDYKRKEVVSPTGIGGPLMGISYSKNPIKNFVFTENSCLLVLFTKRKRCDVTFSFSFSFFLFFLFFFHSSFLHFFFSLSRLFSFFLYLSQGIEKIFDCFLRINFFWFSKYLVFFVYQSFFLNV
jgi:hypothetical protein